MKKALLSLLFITSFLHAQNNKIYLKANALFLPIGMINAGAEFQLSEKYTLQGDFFISPWKSFDNKHAQVYMGHIEGKYYFNEAFKHFYVGANVGAGVFDLTKWNYVSLNEYQRGFNFMLGAVGGYQMHWKERWNIDLFLRIGISQAFYHGYKDTDPPYRYEPAGSWNKSGEWLPYGGGVMISYRLK